MTSTNMLVAVNTKSWTGRYHTNVVWFNDDQHLDNYLAVIMRSEASTLIGHEILEQD